MLARVDKEALKNWKAYLALLLMVFLNGPVWKTIGRLADIDFVVNVINPLNWQNAGIIVRNWGWLFAIAYLAYLVFVRKPEPSKELRRILIQGADYMQETADLVRRQDIESTRRQNIEHAFEINNISALLERAMLVPPMAEYKEFIARMRRNGENEYEGCTKFLRWQANRIRDEDIDPEFQPPKTFAQFMQSESWPTNVSNDADP